MLNVEDEASGSSREGFWQIERMADSKSRDSFVSWE